MRFLHPLLAVLLVAPIIALPVAAHADNPGVVVVPNPSVYKQIIAISDVHGHKGHAQTLLRNVGVINATGHWVGGKTLVVVVGDNIDKGEDSVGVLRMWIALQSEAPRVGGRVITLLGNHEAEFLQNPSAKKSAGFVEQARAAGLTVEALTADSAPIGHFLRQMPVAARIGKWAFCHAGWVPDESLQSFTTRARAVVTRGAYGDPLLLADDSVLEKKTDKDGVKWYDNPAEITELERRLTKDGLFGVVMGHQPDAFEMGDDVGIYKDGRIIKVDSGMADGKKSAGNPGHLLLIASPAELGAWKRPQRFYSVSLAGARRHL